MCFDSETFELFHELTSEGKESWVKYLNDEITWKKRHPVLSYLRSLFGC